MSLLKQITIKNFKSHENTVIDLDTGVNVVYGDPQAGKSNIMRAMELLKDNRPIGAKFMPKRLTKCETEVSVMDSDGLKVGIKIALTKSKKGVKKRESTYYYIENTATGEFWDCTGVGKDVPPEITKALNLNEINIQAQGDPPFLATKSGSKISKTVNKITGLDLGDKLKSVLTTKFNNQKAVVDSVTADLNEQYESIKNFPDMADLQRNADRLENVCKLIRKKEVTTTSLVGYIDRLEDLEKEIIVPDLEYQFNYLRDELNHWIYDYKLKIQDLNRSIGAIEGMEKDNRHLPDLGKQFGRVSILNSKIEKGRIALNDLKSAVHEKQRYNQFIDEKNKIKDDYVETLRSLKKCPTCFQSVNATTLKYIERGLN